MTQKNIDRGINLSISLIVALSGVMLASSLTSSAEEKKALQSKIDSKADISYVDKQNELQNDDIDELKTLFLFEVRELRKDLRLKKEKM